MNTKDIYSLITNQFVLALYEGAPPWIRPWKFESCRTGRPVNAYSGRKYTGINVPILWSVATAKKFEFDSWLTFKQVSRVGGKVRRGEKGTLVVMYREVRLPKRHASGEVELDRYGDTVMTSFKLMRGFTLFNIAQCTDLPERITDSAGNSNHLGSFDPHEATENLVKESGVQICHRGNTACYYPKNDEIAIPYRSSFDTTGGYYSTVLHEFVHWTGHKSRLNRPGIAQDWCPNSPEYAFEELIAEIGTAYLCADLGIPGELRHEGYVLSWIETLERDPRAIFKASSLASQAAQYISKFAPNSESLPDSSQLSNT